MKVWVPIDLPEGCRVSKVPAVFDDTSEASEFQAVADSEMVERVATAIEKSFFGSPLRPETSLEVRNVVQDAARAAIEALWAPTEVMKEAAEQECPEPQRDGWEYHLWPMPSDDSMSGVELSCDTLGMDGWEAFAVVGSVVWFKRRMAIWREDGPLTCECCAKPLDHADWRLRVRHELLCSSTAGGPSARMGFDEWFCSLQCLKDRFVSGRPASS